MSNDPFGTVITLKQSILARIQRPLPEYLFHYTSGPGLHGILSSDSFWGGNYEFMNDRSEFVYSHDLLRTSLRRAAEAARSAELRISLDILAAPNWLNDLNLYLTCFCEAEDLLSQWRGYGGQASRFCLKLTSAELAQMERISPAIPVIYDEELQRQLVDEFVDAHVKILESLPTDDIKHQTYDAAMSLYSHILPLLVSFKSSAFADEREWRYVDLVIRGAMAGPLEFVNGDGMMKPYQTLIVGSRISKKLPIVAVIAGAARYDTQSMTSASLMLQSFGYLDVPVTPSRVPLRM